MPLSEGRALRGGLTFRSSRSQMAAAPQMVEIFDESKCLERLKANNKASNLKKGFAGGGGGGPPPPGGGGG